MRDTVRIQNRPRRAPAEELRAELARLRHDRDAAVRSRNRFMWAAEALGCLWVATLFWLAVAL